jgi:hypothetical protein
MSEALAELEVLFLLSAGMFIAFLADLLLRVLHHCLYVALICLHRLFALPLHLRKSASSRTIPSRGVLPPR